MGKIVFGMMQSLGGYVASVDEDLHVMPVPGVTLLSMGSSTSAASQAVFTVVACTT